MITWQNVTNVDVHNKIIDKSLSRKSLMMMSKSKGILTKNNRGTLKVSSHKSCKISRFLDNETKPVRNPFIGYC